MRTEPPDDLAERVVQAYGRLDSALNKAGRLDFPRREFEELFRAVLDYAKAMKDSPLIHRQVTSKVYGLREYLSLDAFRAPAEVLYEADRLECLLFSGYDPYFDGVEPAGLD